MFKNLFRFKNKQCKPTTRKGWDSYIHKTFHDDPDRALTCTKIIEDFLLVNFPIMKVDSDMCKILAKELYIELNNE